MSWITANKRTLYYYLAEADKLVESEKVIEALRKVPFAQDKLFFIFSLVFNPTIKWSLPEGTPPYRPADHMEEALIYNAMRKWFRYDSTADPTLPQAKREKLFISMLEYLHKDDAKLLIAIKDKQLPFQHITAEVAKKMFPNLYLGEEEKAA